jgi:hypothetical protein
MTIITSLTSPGNGSLAGLRARLTSLLVLASLLLAAVQPGLAQPVSAQADPQAIATAYGDLAVFILNVAAGNGTESPKPERQQVFRQAFAEQFAAMYPALGPDDQQSLASLPAVDIQIQQLWPSLPADQRQAMRDAWAAPVQNMVAGAPCELFDAMARAQLVPSFDAYKQPNIDHLLQCWHDHPELTQDSQERASATGYANAGSGSGTTGDHGTYMAMFNANMLSFTAGMNSASMGTATYTWK